MPNTLGHFGVQGIASRFLFRGVDVRWILFGCLLPDVPWILRRMVTAIFAGADRTDTMMYFTAQSSLLLSLLLCGAVALVTPRPRLLFGLFAFNSLFHLLLDACQIKFGNGVALLAPFSWSLTGFDLFWPEDWPSLVLTGLGVALLLFLGRRSLWAPLRIEARRWPVAVLLLLAYFTLPLTMVGPAYRADVRLAKTLRENRVGEHVAFDRNGYDGKLHAWTGNSYELHPAPDREDVVVSIRGTLRPGHAIATTEMHVHAARYRDYASLVGIAVLAAAFGVGWARSVRGTPPRP